MKATEQMQAAPLTDAQVREKLIHQGAAALDDDELLSILLGRGEGPRSALEVARRLLEQASGSLGTLGGWDLKQLRMTENLGLTRAATLATALELGRRCRAEEALAQETISSDRDVIELFQPRLAGLPHEEFWVVYLNTSNRILEQVRISQGGVSGTVVDPRLIVKRALERLASALVLVHNHPSGSATPSEEDRLLTDKLARAAGLFDIRVVDHVIVCASLCYSFRRHGLLD